MLKKIANKIKAAAVIAVAGLLTMLVGIFFGKRSQWAKEKEQEIEKIDGEIKINEAEIKKKDGAIEKADKVVDIARKDAARAVQNYVDLKKLHDEKLEKVGEIVNVERPEKYERKKFNSNTGVASYFNDLLTELHSPGKGE